MYCQKCRTPLKPDGSLEELNPAAFDLLIGSTGKSRPDPSQIPAAPTSKSPIRPDRQNLYDNVSRRATSPVYKTEVPAFQGNLAQSRLGARDGGHGPGMSFVMLTESQVGPAQSVPDINGDSSRAYPRAGDLENVAGEKLLSDQVENTARLFEIISARSDIDHPICFECTELLMEGFQKRLLVATKERDAYISFLKNLNSSIPGPDEVRVAEQSLENALKAEAKAYEELQALEKEKGEVDKEVTALEEQSRQLDKEEEEFWRNRNSFALTLAEFQNERDALNVKYDHDSRQLDRLQRTNVYNDTFCIGHDGYFGTINGLRLGRLANPSVEWAEINAAWGQTALLLATIADKLDFQFQGYKLRPMGSASRIDKIEYPQQQASSVQQFSRASSNQPNATSSTPKITCLDLFSSGDLPLNLPWLHRRFDAGMVAFLECLRQLGAHVEKTPTSVPSPSPSGRSGQQQQQQQQHSSGRRANQTQPQITGLKLPYEIQRDRIGDASIKLGFNQNDETWTRACKYTLTCCKFLLAHASNAVGGKASSTPVDIAADDARGGR